jgi:uncharacterized repeat protein (TIGR02543 family)
MTDRRLLTVIVLVTAALLAACVYHEIVVINGTGSGTYPLDASVTINANPPSPGYQFYRWTGDNEKVSDIRNATASIHIYSPGKSTVTATYKPSSSLYNVSVQSGDGGGPYLLGEQVQIFAAPPGPGQYFIGWQGDVGVLSNPSQSLQTFPMPAYDLQFTAVYGN